MERFAVRAGFRSSEWAASRKAVRNEDWERKKEKKRIIRTTLEMLKRRPEDEIEEELSCRYASWRKLGGAGKGAKRTGKGPKTGDIARSV